MGAARAAGTAAGALALLLTPFGLGGAAEEGLESRERVGQQRRMPTPLYREAKRPVQRRELVRAEPLGLALAEAGSRDPFPIEDLVVERHRIPAEAETRGQGLETLADFALDQGGWIEGDASVQELLPALHRL